MTYIGAGKLYTSMALYRGNKVRELTVTNRSTKASNNYREPMTILDLEKKESKLWYFKVVFIEGAISTGWKYDPERKKVYPPAVRMRSGMFVPTVKLEKDTQARLEAMVQQRVGGVSDEAKVREATEAFGVDVNWDAYHEWAAWVRNTRPTKDELITKLRAVDAMKRPLFYFLLLDQLDVQHDF
jgi:hypothetical protein